MTNVKTSKNVIQEKNDKKNLEKNNYIYSVGRRKTSVARIRLFQRGKGDIIINDKEYSIYLPYFEWQDIILSPLKSTGKIKNFDFTIKVQGGGIRSQAEAIRTGIARALVKYNENYRKTLKPLGFITRDPRQKERKKPGLKRARRAPQWQKR